VLSTVPIQLDEYDQDIQVDTFRAKYGLDEDTPIILCLSRVAQIKGQDILVNAVPLLKERLKKFCVLIVGRSDYEPEYTRQMQGFVRQHQVEEYVQFIGGVPRQDALAALRACAVHVLPMRFMNSGAVVIETWASHRPVLQSTRIDPVYVDENENGLTFDIDRPEELVDKIVRLINDPALCQRMGANGRRLVEQKFLYPHLIAQYMEAYRTDGGVEV
jgi:phosphatidylinositol alpha-1,6-mannosyltransferase